MCIHGKKNLLCRSFGKITHKAAGIIIVQTGFAEKGGFGSLKNNKLTFFIASSHLHLIIVQYLIV